MKILFAVALASFAAMLWAIYSIARHLRRDAQTARAARLPHSRSMAPVRSSSRLAAPRLGATITSRQ